ncbi:hypothetical protein [Brevibacillus reuszeri]|uniref:hypothetical protein n=1 Tax=Brevibacillus reuszeri TaxID=54915 RepID=UPI000CCBDB32|nr:hypothetical protein [Brevibacillus reuszeri]
MGYFIIVEKVSGEIVTSGQSVYRTKDRARRGLIQWISKSKRDSYAIIELTQGDILNLLIKNGIESE